MRVVVSFVGVALALAVVAGATWALEVEVYREGGGEGRIIVQLKNESSSSTIRNLSVVCDTVSGRRAIGTLRDMFPGQERYILLNAEKVSGGVVTLQYQVEGVNNGRAIDIPITKRDGNVTHTAILTCAGAIVAAVLTQLIGLWRERSRLKFEWRREIYGTSITKYAEFVAMVKQLPTASQLRDEYKAFCRVAYIPRDLRGKIESQLAALKVEGAGEDEIERVCNRVMRDVDDFLECRIYRMY